METVWIKMRWLGGQHFENQAVALPTNQLITTNYFFCQVNPQICIDRKYYFLFSKSSLFYDSMTYQH